MEFIYDDGGRGSAGFKGKTRDCVCRSIAIISRLPYKQVYDGLNQTAKQFRKNSSSSRNGVKKKVYRKYLESLGFKWVPTMFVGKGCKVHLSEKELPSGRLIVSLSRHFTAVIDGVIHDTYDPQRFQLKESQGVAEMIPSRCVYGYWLKEEE